MIQLLCLISLLMYTAYGQCGNSHSQSILFSISINGNQVKRIGIPEYLTAVEEAAQAAVPSGTSNLGVIAFGGIYGGNAFSTKLTVGSRQWSSVQSAIQALSGEDYDSNWGNSVSTAVDQANGVSWTGQRYHIVFSAGMPLASLYGTATTPENYDDPCQSSVTAKKNNIQQFVVLIGEEGIHFVKEHYACMVEDPAEDVIVLNPASSGSAITQLQQRVCKTNGYDVQITEVNPVAGHYHPFIEVLNRGAPADISVCFGSSSGSCSTQTNVGTGNYYVGYGTGGTTSPGGSSGLGSSGGGAGWSAIVKIGGTTQSGATVTYGSGLYWQTMITGRTFELRGAGFNSGYGANWRMSCDPKVDGSPLSAPVECEEVADTCTVENCALNGASGAALDCINFLATQYSICQCTTGYLSDVNTCIDIPVVDTGPSCKVYIIGDDVANKDFTYFTWTKVPYDGEMQYVLTYPAPGPSGVKTWTSGLSAAAVPDAFPGIATGAVTPAITVVAQYIPELLTSTDGASEGVSMTCSVATMDPTKHPTQTPTKHPTLIPTRSPTAAPTFDLPGVFFTNLCGPSRCECFDNARTCCNPFDPTSSTLTSGSGTTPDPAECNHNFKAIEVQSSHESDGLTEVIGMGKYGDLTRTEIVYIIKPYGVINKTEFEDLTQPWTNNYLTTGVRRRLVEEWKLNVKGRQLLQTTPAPLEHGNELSILMEPPGESQTESATGTVVMEDGSDSATLSVDITVGSLKCTDGNCPITYDDCVARGLAFRLTLDSCTAVGATQCDAMYPSVLWIMVSRSTTLCGINFGHGNEVKSLPTWFWWVLLALLIFLLCLAYLVYRFWWKQKKSAGELGDAVDELDQQQADNEAGFGRDLDVGDVAFNPMATGVPGMNRPADAFGNELHQRQLEQQNDMVDVQAEIFQVRQDYGQVATGPRKNQPQQNRGF